MNIRQAIRSLLVCALGASVTACAVVQNIRNPPQCELTRGHSVVRYINEIRGRESLLPLRVDLNLMQAAQKHARDMADNGFMGHDGSDGSSPSYRAGAADYKWVFVAENVGSGYPSAATIVAGWQASPSHRDNNLSEVVQHIGVGYAENPGSEQRTYWVALFGASMDPPTTTPGGCHP